MSVTLPPMTGGIPRGPGSNPGSGRDSSDTPHPDSSVSKRKFPFASTGLAEAGRMSGRTTDHGMDIETDGTTSLKEPILPSRLDLSFSVPQNPALSSFQLPISLDTGRPPRLPLANLHRSYFDLESPTQSTSAGSVDSQATVRQGKNGGPPPPLSALSTNSVPLSPLTNSKDVRSQAHKTPMSVLGFPPPTPTSNASINFAQLMEAQREMQKAKGMTIPMQMEVDKDFLQGPQAGTWTDAWRGTSGDEETGVPGVPQPDSPSSIPTLPPFDPSLPNSATNPAFGSISETSSTHSLTLSERMDRLDTLGQIVKRNLERRPLPASFRLSLPGREEDVSNRASGSKPPSAPLTPQLEAMITRADLAIGLTPGPSSPGFFPSGRSTPALPPITRSEADYISESQLADRLRGEATGEISPLVIDMRPLKEYLDGHLLHSVNLVVPTLIIRRCKRNVMNAMRNSSETPPSSTGESRPSSRQKEGTGKGNILAGGWEALSGFISTDVGSAIWSTAWQRDFLEVVLIADKMDEESARVVEEIMYDLRPDDQVSVNWLKGGWEHSIEAQGENLRDVLRQGHASTPFGGETDRAISVPPMHGFNLSLAKPSGDSPDLASLPKAPRTSGPTQLAFRSVPSRSGRHGLPSLQIPGSKNPSASLRPYPLAQGSLTAVDPYPSLMSPPPMGVSKPRRMIPTPIRIDTFGVANPAPKTGRKPPALDLRSTKANLVVPTPLKSASTPLSGTYGEASGRLRSASGNTTFPHHGTQHGGADRTLSPLKSPASVVQGGQQGFGSLQSVCHAQSGLPPSPSSFGGITRRVNPHYESPSVIEPSGNPYFPPSCTSSSSSDSSGLDYPLSPINGYQATEDDDEDRSPGPLTFTVSTILPSFLYLGPEITSEAEVQKLLDLGVKRILNVAVECDEGERLELQNRFEKYVRLPLRDCVEESGIRKGVMDACQFLDDARLHSSPTYVHCKAGKSRSVTVVLGYLIHANAWTLKTSYAYVAERRKGISPNIGFVAELMQFEEGELGLKASSGIATDSNDDKGANESERDNSQSRRNKYGRESLPPTWGPAMDGNFVTSPVNGSDEPVDDDSVATPRQTATNKPSAQDFKQGMSDLADQRGMNKEVRKNGQYVQFRRAPVNTYTLQPMRRVSKAGLEGLSFFSSSQLSPTHVKQREAVTPSETPGREGWL